MQKQPESIVSNQTAFPTEPPIEIQDVADDMWMEIRCQLNPLFKEPPPTHQVPVICISARPGETAVYCLQGNMLSKILHNERFPIYFFEQKRSTGNRTESSDIVTLITYSVVRGPVVGNHFITVATNL